MNNSLSIFSTRVTLQQQTSQNNQTIFNQNSLTVRQQKIQIRQMKVETRRIELKNEKSKLEMIRLRRNLQDNQ